MSGSTRRPVGGFTEEEWEAALPFSVFVDSLEENPEIWRNHWRRAEVKRDARIRLQNLPGPRRVLVITDGSCGDSARSVPYLAKAFDGTDLVEDRYLASDRQPQVIERFLTHGEAVTPIAVIQDQFGEQLGAWGPRPAPLQEFFRSQWRMMGPPSASERIEFFRPIMAWYARDDGVTVISEVLVTLERGGELA